MPWSVKRNYRECSGWAVVKDSDGSVAGCHETRAKAVRQIAALNASETKARSNTVRQVLAAKIHEAFTVAADQLAQRGYMTQEQRIALSGLIGDVLDDFNDGLDDEVADTAIDAEDVEAIAAKEQSMADEQNETIAVDPRTHAATVDKAEQPAETETKEVHEKGDPVYPYFGVTSFAELDEIQEARDYTRHVGILTEQFRAMIDNILMDGEVEDKAAAIAALTTEYAERVETAQVTKERGLWGRLFGKERQDEEPHPAASGNGLMVWKEANSGRYRVLAIYSNKFRDDDNPSEIISEKSHRTYVDLVDKGIVDYPEGWHWHVKGTRWWKADWVAYADGFALASGYVDKGHEKEAEALTNSPVPIRVSHGMPKALLVRNSDDPSVIDFHITTEISDLPAPAAANRLTDFEVFKENDMALPSEKKEYLKSVAGLDDEMIQRIEQTLTQKAKEADAAGLAFKEAEAETKEETPVEEAPAGEYVTQGELVETLGELTVGFTEAIRSLSEQVGGLSAEVKEMRRDDETRIAEKAANTPTASLSALIRQSVIGTDAARVDGRTALAKEGPQETKGTKGSGLFFEEWIGGRLQ